MPAMSPKRETKPIWARWKVLDDGRVRVVATYGDGGGFVQEETAFESIEQAAKVLGPSFKDVVARAQAAGSKAGRWRP